MKPLAKTQLLLAIPISVALLVGLMFAIARFNSFPLDEFIISDRVALTVFNNKDVVVTSRQLEPDDVLSLKTFLRSCVPAHKYQRSPVPDLNLWCVVMRQGPDRNGAEFSDGDLIFGYQGVLWDRVHGNWKVYKFSGYDRVFNGIADWAKSHR